MKRKRWTFKKLKRTVAELFDSRAFLFWLYYFVAIILACCAGCLNAETGSRTIVGNHFALPKFTTVDHSAEFEIYESTEGAVISTRKDSRVEITYANHFTNTIFGIWHKHGTMSLGVKIEPCEGSETPAPEDETDIENQSK